MVARAWTTIILWLSTLGFSFSLLMTFTTRNQRQVGVGTHEVPPGLDVQPVEYPLYEWYTEYAPDSYMLMVMSIILLLILVNLMASYFVWRGAINVPDQDETKAATRKGAANQRRSADSKTKRDTEQDEYVSSDDGEFMTLEELQRRQRG